MNYHFFEKLDMNKDEVDIFLVLYRLGIQPASVVAKHSGIERTKAYRHLLRLTTLGIIRKTNKNGIQVFFVRDIADLEKLITKKMDDLSYIEESREQAIQQIKDAKKQEL